MLPYLQEILSDIDWRMYEFAIIKSIPLKYSFSPEHREIQIKYSIPAIYAIWEGFVKSCFTIYSHHLNSLSIKRDEISVSLLTHQMDSACDFNSPRTHFNSKQKLVEIIDGILTEVITIKPSVPTESNVNFKVLNKILERFCITPIDDKYEKELDKLLFFRNSIAHGDNSIQVNADHITEFIALIENLMVDVTVHIESSEKYGGYRKNNAENLPCSIKN